MNRDRAREVVVAAITSVAPDAASDLGDIDEDLWYELDLDSMDQLNVMIAISDQTGIEIPESDYPQLQSLTALVDRVASASVD